MLRAIFFFLLLSSPAIAEADETEAGRSLYQTHCSACHSLAPPPKAAPPFRGVIRHYYERYKRREEFIAAVRKFVHKPDSSEVICIPAKERFGLMPKLPVKSEQVETIAAWMWDNKSIWPPRYR